MSYFSYTNPDIVENPRKTTAKNIIQFIQEVCIVCPGADIETETLYNKYKRWCISKNLEYSNFNTFARSFRYYVFHQEMITGLKLHRVNYTAYKEGFGYIQKQGWAYYNLSCNFA